MTTQRHADAERHSEARAGGSEIRQRLDAYGPAYAGTLGGLHLTQSSRQWARWHREDRHADLAGIPDPTDCPILRAARTSAD